MCKEGPDVFCAVRTAVLIRTLGRLKLPKGETLNALKRPAAGTTSNLQHHLPFYDKTHSPADCEVPRCLRCRPTSRTALTSWLRLSGDVLWPRSSFYTKQLIKIRRQFRGKTYLSARSTEWFDSRSKRVDIARGNTVSQSAVPTVTVNIVRRILFVGYSATLSADLNIWGFYVNVSRLI